LEVFYGSIITFSIRAEVNALSPADPFQTLKLEIAGASCAICILYMLPSLATHNFSLVTLIFSHGYDGAAQAIQRKPVGESLAPALV
jgi:hypothetical protein